MLDALLDTRACGEAFEHHANVGVGHRASVEYAECGVPAVKPEARPRVEPAFDRRSRTGVDTNRTRSATFAVEHADDAAAQILAKADKPMGARDLIAAMALLLRGSTFTL